MQTRKGFLKATGAALLGLNLNAQLNVNAANEKSDAKEKLDGATVTSLRIVTWNVACGQWAMSSQIADTLKSFIPDLVLLNEVPKFNQGITTPDWSWEIARLLNLDYFHVGSISSAHHRAPDWGDVTGNYGGKFKSILSRWRLTNTHDYELKGEGWKPASTVRAEIQINGKSWAIYSLHIPGRKDWESSMHKDLADRVLAKEPLKNVIVGGDFNVRTDSEVLKKVQSTAGLKNTVSQKSIDHILYKSERKIESGEFKYSWGPKVKSKTGYLSDHPFVFSELKLGK